MKHNLFNVTKSENAFKEDKTSESQFKVMRVNQLESYNKYRNEQFVRLSQPPGAGKSATVKFCHIEELIKNPKYKILILVPQKMIGDSFNADLLEMPNKTKRVWDVNEFYNLTGRKSNSKSKSNTEIIAKFLNDNRSDNPKDRILKCCYPSFIKAYKKHELSFENTLIIIDEAHHLRAGEHAESNGLGEIFCEIIEKNNPTTKIWLLTATYYRGDGYSILGKENEEKFQVYFLSLEEHFKSMKYVQSYSYDFVPYKGNCPIQELESILRKKKNRKKTIIYVPPKGNKWAGKCKKKTMKKLIEGIHSVWKNANIMDLVSTNGTERDKQKEYLMGNKEYSDIDIVVTVSLLDEGVDWCEAEQVLDINPTNSLRVGVQRFGRLLRDMPHKKHLNYTTFFPYSLAHKNIEECSNQLKNYTTALTLAMSVQESLQPIRIPVEIVREVKKDKTIKRIPKINYFEENVPDEEERQGIRNEILESIQRKTIIEEADGKTLIGEDYKECIIGVLEKHNIKKDRELITLEIETVLYASAVPKITSIDDKLIRMIAKGWDRSEWKDIANLIKVHSSNKIGAKKLQQLKKYFNSQRKTAEEHIELAEQLARENDGILQSEAWLQKNDYKPLSNYVKSHPEIFSHIPQEKEFNTPEENVRLAERLCKKNGGQLQSHSWLRKNGYGAIVSMIYIYPEMFSHIPRKKNFKKEDHIELAEQLAKENGGVLKSHKWLKRDHPALCRCIQTYPELFSHIEQEKSFKTPEEHVQGAKRLAKKNGGVLQNYSWLKKNGYNDLNSYISKYPHLFKGMKQCLGKNIRIIGESE